ncbi:hypothetical protein [Rhodobacter sp. NSM]|uniref:hypothetical protein n=1 Tax=Rhodobacter sp. NSM TaxID=3457501 RepID=UPI003FD35B2A
MTETVPRRRYDRSTPEEILAGPAFRGLRRLLGLADLPTRELRSLHRFLQWSEAEGVEVARVADLLRFASKGGSSRVLADLRLALGRCLPEDAHLLAMV